MFETEFVRNLNCNYERILLDGKPEENRYQYCIVTRGGIRGLLPCSLRYINGQAYLYYDISSTQNMVQLHTGRTIGRQWVKDFLWGMRRVRQEMGRFLLDDGNLIWYPEQIFQDLEKNDFFFLYIPYYEEDSGFGQLVDYLVEHIDYEDQQLVECIYKIHEQYKLLGDVYLKEQIYEDGRILDELPQKNDKNVSQKQVTIEQDKEEKTVLQRAEAEVKNEKEFKKGIRYFWEGKIKKQKEERDAARYQTERMMLGQAVCEESNYQAEPSRQLQQPEHEEELGRTMYMEETAGQKEELCGLYTSEGKEVFIINEQSIILGKKREEADCVLDDHSVSRMHARITMEKDGFYLEDLNSTNGTCKNGLRLQPYEKRRLDKEDEIRLGKVVLFFR